MKIEDTNLHGVKVITPKVHEDSRGFFLESFNKRNFSDAGINYL